jgi:hypothetical protein
MRSTPFASIAAFLALVLSTSTTSHDPPAPHALSAFASNGIWDGDGGATIARLGLPLHTVYLFGVGPAQTVLPGVESCCIADAAMSSTREQIAYSVFETGDQPEFFARVHVVRADGQRVVSFPEAYRFRWSPDGQRLALLYGHASGHEIVPTRVAVWTSTAGTSRSFDVRPDELQWGNRDSLYLGYHSKLDEYPHEDRVDVLDLKTGAITLTKHVGARVSPDGLYSLRWRFWDPMRVRDEARVAEIGGCIQARLGSAAGLITDAFWLRTLGARHLLCVSGSPSYKSAAGQAGCATILIDAGTMDVVDSIPGKYVASVGDGRAIVVLRGDTLAVAPLRVRERAQDDASPRARVLWQRRGWGGPGGGPRGVLEEPGEDRTFEVRTGDWLPGAYTGGCDLFFRVLSVGPEQVRVAFPAGQLIAPGGSTEVGEVVITRAPLKLTTPSVCGGENVFLSIAR